MTEFEFLELRRSRGHDDVFVVLTGTSLRAIVSAVSNDDLLIAGGNVRKSAFKAGVLAREIPEKFSYSQSLIGAIVSFEDADYRVIGVDRHIRSEVVFLTINER